MPPHALSPPARFQLFPLAESATPRSFCRRRHKGHAGGLKGGQPARVSRSILTVAYPIRSTLDLFLCMANMQLWILRRDSPTKSSLPLPPEISRVRPRRPWAIIATWCSSQDRPGGRRGEGGENRKKTTEICASSVTGKPRGGGSPVEESMKEENTRMGITGSKSMCA